MREAGWGWGRGLTVVVTKSTGEIGRYKRIIKRIDPSASAPYPDTDDQRQEAVGRTRRPVYRPC